MVHRPRSALRQKQTWLISDFLNQQGAGQNLYLHLFSYNVGPMPYSATSLTILRAMRDGNKFLLRGDRSHACQVRYNPVTKQREDRTTLSLIPLERAGLIKFESEPLNPNRYYSVKITKKGMELMEEKDDSAQKSPDTH